MNKEWRSLGWRGILVTTLLVSTTAVLAQVSPYPPSTVFKGITWDWGTLKQAAPGSDLWPVTWAADGNLYLAWGDGGGFGGTDSEGRVSMGFARLQGSPESFTAVNVNGGEYPQNPASFPTKGNGGGKTGGIVSVDGVLYAWLNKQDGKWPKVNQGLVWSRDFGATWQTAPWVFPRGAGRFKPVSFVQFGRDYDAVPKPLAGFVYFCAQRQGQTGLTFMGRVPRSKITDRQAYQFITGFKPDGAPVWGSAVARAVPISPAPSAGISSITYLPQLQRYLACGYHSGPGQLGIFDAANPWGPWTTVAYYDNWGQMGPEGEGLCCNFPLKWVSTDGLTMWCVFSVYGPGAKKGINAHDRFNLVKLTLSRRG